MAGSIVVARFKVQELVEVIVDAEEMEMLLLLIKISQAAFQDVKCKTWLKWRIYCRNGYIEQLLTLLVF